MKTPDKYETLIFLFPKAYFSETLAFEIIESRNWFSLWKRLYHIRNTADVYYKVYYFDTNVFCNRLNSGDINVEVYWIYVHKINVILLKEPKAYASKEIADAVGVKFERFMRMEEVVKRYLKLRDNG